MTGGTGRAKCLNPQEKLRFRYAKHTFQKLEIAGQYHELLEAIKGSEPCFI